MRRLQIVSLVILVITLVIWGVNKLIFPMNDWVIRMDGLIMMIGLVSLSYSSVKIHKGEK